MPCRQARRDAHGYAHGKVSAREMKSRVLAELGGPRMMWSMDSNPSHSIRDFNSSVSFIALPILHPPTIL